MTFGFKYPRSRARNNGSQPGHGLLTIRKDSMGGLHADRKIATERNTNLANEFMTGLPMNDPPQMTTTVLKKGGSHCIDQLDSRSAPLSVKVNAANELCFFDYQVDFDP
ncbi:MAG: hypothetical protein FD135_1403 [Comamonadaceae bacterium]|nr:MAG: hypothetical protein FD135_1403 [Comamonadaceae bacterium]